MLAIVREDRRLRIEKLFERFCHRLRLLLLTGYHTVAFSLFPTASLLE